ncbi:uncharacterized protein LOC144452267 [Glandiceps talaboti]
MTSFVKSENGGQLTTLDKEISETPQRVNKTTLNLLICAAFIIFEVSKQVVTYGTKEYNNGQYPISLTTIVVFIELVKLVISFILLAHQGGVSTMKLSWRFAIPSFIYGMNNNLFLYALHFAPPPLWNVLIQSRVLMTAVVYRVVFKRDVPPQRWAALLLLIVGISLAEVSNSSSAHSETDTSMSLVLRAVLLSLVSAALSTAASIYTEYLFKNDRRSFFEQQVQLYFFGAVMTGIWAMYVTKGNPIAVQGALNATILWLLILTILLGGAGGLLVAAIIKNIDNIAKIYSATFAIFLTAIVCSVLFPENFSLNLLFVAAVVTILVSSVLYERAKPKPKDSEINGASPKVVTTLPRQLSADIGLKTEHKG